MQKKLTAHVFASQKLFADDTPVPVLDPGRGRTRTGMLWVYARDDRPWVGPDPPVDVYLFAACWAHARRKFHDVHEATSSPIAHEALRRIGEL